MYPSRTLSISIRRPWTEVYDFACRPESFRRWAAGLGQSLRHDGGQWVVDTPDGPASVRFTAANAFGILDHHVLLPDGSTVYVPLRVVANADGAEVALTLFRLPAMTDADFERDAGLVTQDLQTLKALLEG